MDTSSLDLAGVAGTGTPKQGRYLADLAQKAGYTRLLDAINDVLPSAAATVATNPLSVEDASKVIKALEGRVQALPKEPPSAAAEPPAPPPTASADGAKPRFLTARQLRQIAAGRKPVPDPLDDDAAWVLDALRRLAAIEGQTGVNGAGPITVAHLLAYYHTLEALALAFGVSVSTVKSWGEVVPRTHWWRAQGMTLGYVRVPPSAAA